MRSVALCVLASLAFAVPAAAQQAAPAPAPTTAPAAEPTFPSQGRADGRFRGMNPDNLPPDPTPKPRQRPRPSGYWTGYRPAKGGDYRWRMLAIGLAVLALTALLVTRMLRRVPGRTVGRKRPTASVTS